MVFNFSIFGIILTLLSIVVAVFVLGWIRCIYQNSEKQVEQNEKIIELLREIKEKEKS
ncbi:hypothetical protein CN553_15380 [Bacillus cereus]|uniref:DUF4083 domain-containing protein n=1 Tax=Bacillus cereus TaxID=1396 RepID=A0A9X6UBA8_BACCE|nr:hypothetical protein [Bacillus cereus]PEN96166.1 hypothetical protein CN553_15380 [Bacillus cereus]